jgi:hypothetical protein
MANDDQSHTHRSLAAALGALGPGGMATITFDDHERLFGSDPSENELEGQRAAGKFAADNGCEHGYDHAKKWVWFRKK